MPVPLPPREEQEALVVEMADRLGRLGEVMQSVTHAISLLQEYRTSLISHAVTGKLDVRDKVEVSA